MAISPLYELLVFIEDKGSAQVSDFTLHNKNQVRGILGKMEAMKLVEKFDSRYSLSRNGQAFLNSILDVLHQPTSHWDGLWRFIGFSISEKNRSKRDKFRRELEGLGLRPYLNSFWITPLDLSDQILDKAKSLEIDNDVILIASSSIEGKTNEELVKSWNFESSRQLFEEFIASSEKIIKKSDRTSFDLKMSIFNYALVLNSQPRLPIELMPKDWPQFRANLQYKKIRRLIK